MTRDNINVQMGFSDRDLVRAAIIYDEAFGQKLLAALPSKQERLTLLENSFVPQYAFAAKVDSQLAGIAGLQTTNGAILDGVTYRALLSQLGFMKGHWAAFILSFYEHKLPPGELYLDSIAVHPDFRGYGIGGNLLDAVESYARANDYERVVLNVIDTNLGAQKLYERKGYQVIKQEKFPYLRWLLNFGGVTTMALPLK